MDKGIPRSHAKNTPLQPARTRSGRVVTGAELAHKKAGDGASPRARPRSRPVLATTPVLDAPARPRSRRERDAAAARRAAFPPRKTGARSRLGALEAAVAVRANTQGSRIPSLGQRLRRGFGERGPLGLPQLACGERTRLSGCCRRRHSVPALDCVRAVSRLFPNRAASERGNRRGNQRRELRSSTHMLVKNQRDVELVVSRPGNHKSH
jgi:hypothetical protein